MQRNKPEFLPGANFKQSKTQCKKNLSNYSSPVQAYSLPVPILGKNLSY